MLALTANDDIKLTCITCFAECKTGMFQRLHKEWDPEKPLHEKSALKAFCILTGANFDSMLRSTDSDVEIAIYQCTAFLYNEPMTFANDPVEVMRIRGKLISIPKKLGNLTFEQNAHIRTALKGAKKLEELISLACAVYLQPLVDGGPYDHDKAMELEKEICEMPIWQTYAIGFFYLSKLNNYGRSGLLKWSPKTRKLIENGRKLLQWLKPNSLNPSAIFH